MAEINPARYRAGQGEPLVLIHGFTATWRCWQPVIAELVPRFDVFAPTLPGHDGGPPPSQRVDGSPRTIGDGADELEQLLDEQGIETAHLVGNSLGGALSLELAKRGRARSVVAISPGGGWREGDVEETERVIRWFKRTRRLSRSSLPRAEWIMRSPVRRRAAFRDVMTRGDQVPRREAVQLMRSSLECTVFEDVFATIRSGNARLVDLDRIACPVLVAWGDRDRILPMSRHAPRLREEIPGVEFRVLAGLGHTPMWDDATLLATMVADFASAAAAAPALT